MELHRSWVSVLSKTMLIRPAVLDGLGHYRDPQGADQQSQKAILIVDELPMSLATLVSLGSRQSMFAQIAPHASHDCGVRIGLSGPPWLCPMRP